ncbi:MAG: hypothetical protein KJ957_03695 [Candidatus Omnitrophica bacterium]|nr:hypothetical protein [Candidatus Omnitrophota bacterium]
MLSVAAASNAAESLEEKSAQFFIKLDENGVCNTPKEAVVFTLDSYGLIDKSFEGLKKVSIFVKEIGGKKLNSFKELPGELEFQKGRASFFIEDSEPETLELDIIEGKNRSPFPASITFKEKSPPERLEIKLASRGNINEPQKGALLALDKDGDITIDYSQKGLNIAVKELGRVDKSFTLDPGSLDIYEGKASFSITNSEEDEELLIQLSDPKGRFKPIEARITFSVSDKEPPEIIDLKMETLAFVELTFSEELDDGSATDPNNYEVVCSERQRPRSVEFHGDRVILELDDLLRSHEEMYVEARNLKDLSGNEMERGARSPDYAVPYVPLRLDTDISSNPAEVGTTVTITIVARCTSGRIPQFINGQFEVEVTEQTSDGSYDLSSLNIQMTRGEGKFTVSNSSPETLTIIVSDSDGEVDSTTLELKFI